MRRRPRKYDLDQIFELTIRARGKSCCNQRPDTRRNSTAFTQNHRENSLAFPEVSTHAASGQLGPVAQNAVIFALAHVFVMSKTVEVNRGNEIEEFAGISSQ